jgi:hypothetical protein
LARFEFSGDASFKSMLIELQDAFASKQFSDELNRMDRRRRQNKTYITRNRGQPLMIKRLLAMALRIDGDLKHGRPHLHVDYGGNYHKASYAIDDGQRLAGGLDSKYDKAVREWIGRNRRKLIKAWSAITSGRDAKKLVAMLRQAD